MGIFSSSELAETESSPHFEQYLAKLEPFVPLAVGIHGMFVLFFVEGTLWTWILIAIVSLLGIWGFSHWGKSKQALFTRAGLMFILTWLLLLNTGGTNSFFWLWCFVLITTYPVLLPSHCSILFIIGMPLTYCLLWPFSPQPLSLFVILGRALLLTFLGWFVWTLGTAAMRQIQGYQQRARGVKQYEQQLYQVIETIPVMMNAFDDDFNVVMWNKECERVTGFTTAEIIGNPQAFKLLFPTPAYRARMRRAWREQHGHFRRWILDVHCKDGTVKQVAWSNTGQAFPLSVGSVWNIGIDVTGQMQAEAEVQQSAKLLKVITDNFPYAYLSVINQDWTIDFTSGQEFKNQQLNPERFIGLKVQEVFSNYGEDIISLMIGAYEKTFAGEPQMFEFIIENQYLLTNTAPLADADGSISQILVVVQNITERKRAEQELQTMQARLTGIIESAMDAIITVDQEHRILLFNHAAENLFGLPAAVAIGQSFEQFIPERFRPIHREHVTQFAQSGTTNRRIGYLDDVPGLRANGEEFPIEASISHITVNGQQLLTVILRDISERKEAEARIHYQAGLLANMQDAIIATDPQFYITSWNKGAEAMYGWREEEVLGKSTNQVLHSEFTNEQRTMAEQELYRKGRYRVEVVQHHRNGQRLQIEGVVIALYDSDGRVTGYVAVNRNITERKQLEERLRQAQKMEAIGHLAGGIAHDFNNILVPIIGYTELSMVKVETNSKIYANLSQIKKAADRATGLIRQILAFSRKQVLTMQIIDLNVIVADFQKMIQRLIGEDIEFQARLSPSWYPIKADKTQIEQVLMNLAVNARDAMPKGGKLIVETSNIYLNEAYIETNATIESAGSYALLTFKDTGHGMDENIQHKIFEPFFTTKERGKGTGLGLATVFGIIQQHHGHIGVDSEPGRGTIFKIYLPHVQDAISPGSRISEMPDSVYGTETILVVEDEEMVRKLVCETLEGFGYQILQAATPEDCLQLLDIYKDDVHLLLTDVIMPQMNGQELYREVHKRYPYCKVLYMSGYTDNVTMVDEDLFNEGQNFLQKPFTVHALGQKVREAIG